jgi:hypothetical protein
MILHIINSVLTILIIVLSIPLKIISWIIQIINPGMKAKKWGKYMTLIIASILLAGIIGGSLSVIVVRFIENKWSRIKWST